MKSIRNKGWLSRLAGISAALACALVLAACGGGGGDSGTSPASSRYNLSFNTGEWSTIFFGGNNATGYIKLTKTSTESSASPDVSSQTVHLSASVPGALSMPSSVTTNSEGEAEFTISAANMSFYASPVTVVASVDLGYTYSAKTVLNVNNRVDRTITTSDGGELRGLGDMGCSDIETYFVNVSTGDVGTPISTDSEISVLTTGGAVGVANPLGLFGSLGKVWVLQVRPPLRPACSDETGTKTTGQVGFTVEPTAGAPTYLFGYFFDYIAAP